MHIHNLIDSPASVGSAAVETLREELYPLATYDEAERLLQQLVKTGQPARRPRRSTGLQGATGLRWIRSPLEPHVTVGVRGTRIVTVIIGDTSVRAWPAPLAPAA